ncbi:ornithine cyclodeaminase family protein [Mumia sp. zg.B53]|uniref:ornithine cyclodeaminase family protein n=2 Tax=Mumia TaxID=1546255 RepID=UPI001C6E20B7|nr:MULTISPECIES: ornithine cyclodeaminase family protein [unclassified Mumia]MBW9207037.1 ornithine cyclodeaminase family protein [Mumia sp. zg.B17]MBW9215240.1 ornithine cyclodeaminase family protein [Mumia sp. zg.B53]
MTTLPYLDASAVSALRPRDAVEALLTALRDGLDPTQGTPRTFVPLTHGEYIVMPAENGADTGVKIVTVAPRNRERGLPRIQGIYVLFDARTLAPRALLDGIELTALRTPAVSLAGVRQHLLADTGPLHVVAYGVGIQAVRHVATAADVVEGVRTVASVTYVARDPRTAEVPELVGVPTRVVAVDSAAAAEAVGAAGLILCATSAREPVFDGTLVADDAIVVAVGSHDPDAREVDEHLVGRSRVVVEDRRTALREAGDVVMAVAAGTLDPLSLVTLAEVAAEPVHAAGRPVFFKSVGMAWEDLVVAAAALDAVTGFSATPAVVAEAP